ncbi:MAG: DNA translocase FtsK 4TM domain-containing protein, partial [Burkholderiaceae bacterium]
MRLLHEARWLALAVLALFLLLILATYDPADPGWSHAAAGQPVRNAGGRVGAWFADLLLYLFGVSAYLLALAMGVSVLRGMAGLRAAARAQAAPGRRPAGGNEALEPAHRFAWERWLGFALLLIGCVALESARLYSMQVMLPLAPGGVLGSLIATPLLEALGAVGGTLVLLAMIAAGLSLWTGWSWLAVFERVGTALEWLALRAVQILSARKDRRIGSVAAIEREELVQEKRKIFDDDPEPVRIAPPPARIVPSERAQAERQTRLFTELPADTELPQLSLLDEPAQRQESVSAETLEYTSRLIEKKLSDFNVAANVAAAQPGPVITRYEIEPATGVKGSQIVNLSKDLARALSLVSIRVVETIPGKNLMGLELPNARRQTVRLSEILGSQVYANSASPLTLALGQDIAGNAVVADLAKMPHLLVAGTTGSGKSVGINVMLLSLLYKADPSQVRLILIDPKMLEMSTYEGIPHLLAPVVTDMRHAGNALNWCVAEMERRYRLMSKL